MAISWAKVMTMEMMKKNTAIKKDIVKKILYVEDHEDTAEVVREILSKAGYEIQVATTGKEGISRARQGFDLVLLDIMLPDMSGWDIFQTLKKLKLNSRYVFLSVIPVSAERLKDFKSAGIYDYITKPFKVEDFKERIEKALSING